MDGVALKLTCLLYTGGSVYLHVL